MCEDSISFDFLNVGSLAYLPYKVFSSVRVGFLIFAITTGMGYLKKTRI
jgi:hypothetical protein